MYQLISNHIKLNYINLLNNGNCSTAKNQINDLFSTKDMLMINLS